MNSTERLLAVFRGEIPDRVPISTYELDGWNMEAFHNKQPSYKALMDVIREKTDCMYYADVIMKNAAAKGWKTDVEKWDEGEKHFKKETIHAGDRNLVQIHSHIDGIHTRWTIEHPIKDLDDLNAWLQLPWEPSEPDYSTVKRAWNDLGDTRGLPMISIGDPICLLAELFEFGNFTIHAFTETDAMVKALDQLHERYREELRRILANRNLVKNAVFRICGPEYATPPYLSPEYFEKFVTKYDTEYIQMIREAGGIPRIHSHGKIGKVIGQIAQMGPDALDPCEPPPDGDITLTELKKAVGDKICLTGGIELKHLEMCKLDEVRKLTREAMEMGKPGGRFIIMPTAAPVHDEVAQKTVDNYLCMIETALEMGEY